MKRFSKIFLTVASVLVAFSCTTDVTEDLGVQIGAGEGQTSVTISLGATRAQLGEKADGVYPLYWSEGDQVAINGVVSNSITLYNGGTAATFSFAETIARPWNVVYPAPAEGTTAVTEGYYPVVFPAEQSYVAGSFDPKALVMCGNGNVVVVEDETTTEGGATTASTEGETTEPATEGETITLRHLTGVLRFAIKGTESLTKMVVTAEKGNLAGTYDVNCATGALVPQEGKTSSSITLSFGEGLQLKAEEATPVYVAVPAGEFNAVEARIYTADNKAMVVKFSSFGDKGIKAGTVREFAEFVFVENSVTADEEGVFEIATFEDLQKFAQIAPTFHPRTEAKLVADIVVPEGTVWEPIEGFTKTFNGNNLSISGLNAPLFGTVSATIKDLALKNVNIEISSAEAIRIGSIAGYIIDGGLTNCSAEGTLTVALNQTVGHHVGGLVGSFNRGAFTNNVNNVDIVINGAITETNETILQLGGVAGYVINPQGKTIDSTNNGTITVNGDIDRISCGGFVGYLDAAAEVENCHNNGEMLLAANLQGTAFHIFTGFIGSVDAGFDVENPTLKITDCSNTADVTFGTKAGDDVVSTIGKIAHYTHIGGFLGHTRDVGDDPYSAEIVRCVNRGNVLINAAEAAKPTKISGVASHISCSLEMSNCVNYGKLSINGGTTSNIFVGALISHAASENAAGAVMNITNSSNEGEIYVSKIAHEGTPYLGGITGYVDVENTTYNLKGVENNATITFANITSGSNQYAGSIIGYVRNSVLSMEDCTNNGKLNYYLTRNAAGGTIYHGGIIGHCGASNVATLKNVINNGDIVDNATALRVGIAGLVASTANSIILENCENNGSITYECTQEAMPKFVWLGGLTSLVLQTGVNKVVTANGCTNTGDLTISNTICAAGGQIGIGGITAQMPYMKTNKYYGSFELTDCTNTGNILLDESAAPIDNTIGGILGANGVGLDDDPSYAIIKNPTQKGNITVKLSTETGYPLSIGGIVGEMTGAESYISKGDSATASVVECNFSIDVAKVGNYNALGGIVGAVQSGTATLSDITVSENSSFTYKAGSHTANNHCGGLVGYCPSAITCKNLTNNMPISITIGSVTANYNYIGGGIGRMPAAGNLDNCVNNGDITYEVTGSCTPTTHFGGLIGSLGTAHGYITDCANSGNLTVKKGGGKYGPLYIGGGSCYDSSKGTETNSWFNFTNSGNITVEDGTTSSGYVRIGGCIAWAIGDYNENLKNTGDIHIGITSTHQILAGGVYGYSSGSTYPMDGGFVNTGDITITGGTGTSTNAFAVACGGIVGAYYGAVTGAINTGNITFTGTGSTANSTFGGIVGFSMALGEISGCQSFCDMYVNGSYSVGMITGSARSAEVLSTGSNLKAVVRNCQLGGRIATTMDKIEDADGNSTDTPRYIDLTSENFMDEIYGQTVSWDDTNYDGCTLLTAKPVVE